MKRVHVCEPDRFVIGYYRIAVSSRPLGYMDFPILDGTRWAEITGDPTDWGLSVGYCGA